MAACLDKHGPTTSAQSSDKRRLVWQTRSHTISSIIRWTAACLTNTVSPYHLCYQMNGGLSDKHCLTLSALLSDERQPMTPVSIYSLQEFKISWKEPSPCRLHIKIPGNVAAKVWPMARDQEATPAVQYELLFYFICLHSGICLWRLKCYLSFLDFIFSSFLLLQFAIRCSSQLPQLLLFQLLTYSFLLSFSLFYTQL